MFFEAVLQFVLNTHHTHLPDITPSGDATDDWSILSGGGDGTVAHWSVLGLARRREEGIGGRRDERGIQFIQIGGYEVKNDMCRIFCFC